jgi:glucose-6-phosphate 1-dehydrogenase
LCGQYEGYLQERNVKPNSTTETFTALKLSINNKRWKDVPFYIKAGKFLNTKNSSIHIKFKKADCLMRICPLPANYLTINIHPNEGMFLELNVKIPSTQDQVMPVKMNFSHASAFGPNTPEAYEVLLLDVMNGDQSAFVRHDEINLSWKIIAQVEKIKSNLYGYTKGSHGPVELKKWNTEENMEWRI